jgi:hypothetical protein
MHINEAVSGALKNGKVICIKDQEGFVDDIVKEMTARKERRKQCGQ